MEVREIAQSSFPAVSRETAGKCPDIPGNHIEVLLKSAGRPCVICIKKLYLSENDICIISKTVLQISTDRIPAGCRDVLTEICCDVKFC